MEEKQALEKEDKRKKGEWEKRYRYANIWNFRCSECGMTCPQSASKIPTYKFCPHCSHPMKVK